MLVIWIIGFCMMAACRNVETYAAAQAFSMVGYEGPNPPGLYYAAMLI
jgi:hypothetical protein